MPSVWVNSLLSMAKHVAHPLIHRLRGAPFSGPYQDLIALAVLAIVTGYGYGSLLGDDPTRSFGEGSVFIGQPLLATGNLILNHGLVPYMGSMEWVR